MDPRRESLFDVEWQVLRVGLLGNWHETPEQNVLVLVRYVRKATGEADKLVRLWRCINLLRAVPLGENKRVRRTLLRSRRIFERKYKVLQDYGNKFPNWSWARVRADLRWLLEQDPSSFRQLKGNLEGRMQRVGQLNQSYMQAKPETAKFIRLMRDVEFEGEGTQNV